MLLNIINIEVCIISFNTKQRKNYTDDHNKSQLIDYSVMYTQRLQLMDEAAKYTQLSGVAHSYTDARSVFLCFTLR